ncbi:MAG: hypothetical protein P0116_02865 [Candidatus Nitrosocosmicus sp.]|nr:hypothetical protein [Candidatus Nitrosocosmicus sp.]
MIVRIRNVIMLALSFDKVVRTIKLNRVIAVYGEHYAHAYYQGFIQGCISSGGGSYFACNEKTSGPP